jgi:hypothetical protein
MESEKDREGGKGREMDLVKRREVPVKWQESYLAARGRCSPRVEYVAGGRRTGGG